MSNALEFEDMVLSSLIENSKYLQKVIPYLKVDHFESNKSKTVFQHINHFVEKYKKKPTSKILSISLNKQRGLPEKIYNDCVDFLEDVSTESHDLDWLIDETEQWGKRREIQNAIYESIDVIDGSHKEFSENHIPEILRKAIAFSFDKNIGHNYLEDYKERFDDYNSDDYRIPFNLESLNEVTDGGPTPGTVVCVTGGTNSFKTGFMCDQASYLMSLGKNVLYITMEMGEYQIAERIDANRFDEEINNVHKMGFGEYESNINKLKRMSYGTLIIKEYPTAGANMNNFRSLVKELEIKNKFKPDAIFIDYLNICTSTRFSNISDLYSYNKAIAEEMRGFAKEMNLVIYTGTQLNRSGQNEIDPELGHISESHGVSATVDFMFAISTNEELQEQNIMIFKQLKNRFGSKTDKTRFAVRVNVAKMSLYNMSDDIVTSTDIVEGRIASNQNSGLVEI